MALWKDVIRPVLSKLGLLGSKSGGAEALPRVRWIGAGFAAMLPFHAAGDHSPGSTESTLTHILSSYTMTLKSLQYARRRALGQEEREAAEAAGGVATRAVAGRHHQTLLIAAMPKTLEISGQLAVEVAVMLQPSKSDVLDTPPRRTIFHFAGHGRGDPDEFYRRLLVADSDLYRGESVARALHEAILRLREEIGAGDLLKWGPFVHIEA